ncbi:MAG: ANTAR domain-containing protein [Lachnospiraceae bacterium]|nr:ANTAR domain-containing protein [Lachnospiraceae bacterium]
MGSIIIAMPKIEDSKVVAEMLRRRGFDSADICRSSNEILQIAADRDSGVVICMKKIGQMGYFELAGMLPDFFDMVLLESSGDSEFLPNVKRVMLPLKAVDLSTAVEELFSQQNRRLKKFRTKPRQRTEEEQQALDAAKKLLMEKKGMTEPESYRYIQKSSMDSGTSMAETARMILVLNRDG